MPLSEKARIEVYIPDLPQQIYQNLLDALAQEFTYTFGGATIIRGLDGSYLSRLGVRRYTDALREAAFEALTEEAILVVVLQVYHAE